MAKYDVTCRHCQSTFEVQLYGPHRDRQWKLDNWTWFCDDCKEAEKLEASRMAAEEAEKLSLPELDGTEKQIRWAEVLRLRMIREIDEGLVRWQPIAEKEEELRQAAIAIKGNKSARFWIDNRDRSVKNIILEHIRNNPIHTPAEKSLEADAAIEATIRPENVLSETVAEIRHFDDRVEISFPEKREDFWKLVKKELGYTWSGSCWVRKIGLRTGSAEDRSAEAGNRILSLGFPIRIYDEGIKQKAISGDYKPECQKWVMARTEGKYAGWFSLTWSRESGDYWKGANRLPGSRYDKPAIVVPSEHYDEVLDFAEVHGFQVSPGALNLAEKARIAKEAALTAAVQDVPRERTKKTGGRPALGAPEQVEVPDDLKD